MITPANTAAEVNHVPQTTSRGEFFSSLLENDPGDRFPDASTGDFSEALTALLGPEAPGLSASTITRLKADWWDDYERWSRRDLSARRYVYFWADGVYFSPRMDEDRQCMLVIIGADEWGNKDVLGLIDGFRESTQSWRELLLDLKRRGLEAAPKLAVGDGAMGFWAALHEVYGKTRVQRCWVHN